MLCWDTTGFCLYFKRLEHGRFHLTAFAEEEELNPVTLQLILEGPANTHPRGPRSTPPGVHRTSPGLRGSLPRTANPSPSCLWPMHGKSNHRFGPTDDLECVTMVHDLTEAEKNCPCGNRMEQVAENHILLREFVPAKCHHEDHVYPRYVCTIC